MKIRIAVATLMALLISFVVAAGEIPPPPATSQSGSTAGPEFPAVRGPSLMSENFAGATIEVIPFLGPAPGTPQWWTIARLIEDDYRGGTLGQGTNYLLCRGKIGWRNVVVPGDWILQQLVVVKAKDDSWVTLSGIVMEATSTGGALSDIYTTGNFGYSQAALGEMPDGSLVMSGRGDLEVKRVLFVVVMKLFIGGETQAGLDAVETWVGAQGNFTIAYEVTLAGDPTGSVGRAQVSIEGFAGNRPRLAFVNNRITLVAGDLGRIYSFQESSDPAGPWTTTGILQLGGEPVLIADLTQPMRFYRVVGE